MPSTYSQSVFVNCPYDPKYEKIYNAIVFTICDCGFIPRSAEEAANNAYRLNRILEIISESKYAIHDLSRSGAYGKEKLARFNMPLELGFDIGAQHYGGKKLKDKCFLILDVDRYRYQKVISDLNAFDPRSHNNNVDTAIRRVRDWLNDVTNVNFQIPGGVIIARHYKKFRSELPMLAKDVQLKVSDLTYRDYCFLIQEWIPTIDN